MQGHLQLSRNGVRGLTIKRLTPERQPGLGRKTWFQKYEQAAHHLTVVLPVPMLAGRRRCVTEFLELVEKITTPNHDRPMLPRAPEMTQPVDQDRSQPTSERAGRGPRLEIRHFLGNGQQYILNEIVDVSGQQNVEAPQPGAQQGRVQLDQPIPGLGVGLLA